MLKVWKSRGGAKITTLATDNSADKLVVQLADGTLAVRQAATLGGGLAGIQKVIFNTTPENVPDGFYPAVATALCPIGKFVVGGTCTDSNNALDEWGQNGSGTASQFTNSAFGRSYACRSRNGSGITQNNLVVTATAICATIP